MTNNIEAFIEMIKHPVKFRMFLFSKVPTAYFSGLKLESISATSCSISVPYKWLTRNPFRSTYFATLSMAGEMSTGALAMAYLYKIDKPVSLLVTAIQGNFLKKATERTFFTCNDGQAFATAIAECLQTGEARTVRAVSSGRNKNGDLVAEFEIIWSFKAKSGARKS